MGYRLYLYSSAALFLLMVASGIGYLITGNNNLVIAVAGCFILAMITIQMAKKAAKKEIDKIVKELKK